MTERTESAAPASSLEVRARLVEALKLDLVGPWAGHALAEERLAEWPRPSNWYLTGFLVPSGTPPDKRADADEGEEFGEVPESAGLPEESSDDRKAAKKSFFPSSMGLSFLVPKETAAVTVIVRWGDYQLAEIEGHDGKALTVWQRQPREATIAVALTGASGAPAVHRVPGSGGLQLHIVERPIAAEELAEQIPHGTRSVSIFLVNHRAPVKAESEDPDRAYVFQPEIEVRSDLPFVPRPDLRGARAAEWDEQMADLHYADTPEYATGHGGLRRVGARGGCMSRSAYRLDRQRRGGEDDDRAHRRCGAGDGVPRRPRRWRGGRGRAASARPRLPAMDR